MPVVKYQPLVFYIPNQSGGVDAVQIDACIDETHTLTNKLTHNPVEKGPDVTDHSRPEPRTLAITGIQSNTPLGRTVEADEDSAAELWQRFVSLWAAPRLIAIQTVRDYYADMGMESCTTKVDAATAQSLPFSASFTQVTVVQNKLINVVVSKDTRAKPPQKQGQVQTKPTEPDVDPLRATLNAAGI